MALQMASSSTTRNGDRIAYTAGVVLVFVLSVAVCLDTVTAQRVNCRKFVFAPICRGTASKRTPLLLPVVEDNELYRIQDGKPEIVDAEYRMATIEDGENKKSAFREMMKRQRTLVGQMDRQQKSEPFDPSIYDY